MVVINLVLLATALFVVIVEGFNWFAIWAIVPLIGAAVLAEFLLSSAGGEWAKTARPKRSCVAGLILGVVLVTLYVHVTWLFDLWGTARQSSGSGTMFILAPLYAFLGGGGGYVLGYYLGRRADQGSEPEEPPSVGVDDRKD